MPIANVDDVLPKIPGLKSSEVEPAHTKSKRRSNKKIIINVDPEFPGKSCSVDMTNVTPEQMDQAVKAAKLIAGGDQKEQAVQTYKELAKIVEASKQPVRVRDDSPKRIIPPLDTPAMDPNASVVVRSSECYTAVPVSQLPVVTPPMVTIPTPVQPPTPCKALLKVEFEMYGWGKLHMNYHSVVKNECLLVLCWDTNDYHGYKFFPPAATEPMIVRIGDCEYSVFSYGNTFKHDHWEYCLLVIDKEHQGEG